MDVPWTVRGHIERLNRSVWIIKFADSSEHHNQPGGTPAFLFSANHTTYVYYDETVLLESSSYVFLTNYLWLCPPPPSHDNLVITAAEWELLFILKVIWKVYMFLGW